MSDQRPVLIGMLNPLSMRPEHALYPSPAGCTGHRIFEMLRMFYPDVCEDQYLAAFDRRNLIRGTHWSITTARMAAKFMLPELRGREVVVLGAGPRDAFGLEKMLIHPQRREGVVFRQLPHPSGRNLWYNDTGCRRMAAALFAELYVKSTKGGSAT